MGVFDKDNKRAVCPPHVLDFIIDELRLKKSRKIIVENVKAKFNIDIRREYITDTRMRYEKLSGERLPISSDFDKKIVDFTIKQLRQGIAPRFILQSLKDKFDFDRTRTFLLYVRKNHKKATGEYIPTHREIKKNNKNAKKRNRKN